MSLRLSALHAVLVVVPAPDVPPVPPSPPLLLQPSAALATAPDAAITAITPFANGA